MKRWFARLPIHRKLVVVALVVTTVALMIATAGLMAIDLWRYRSSAFDEAISLARVLAENTAAAVRFADEDAARDSLQTVRVRPTIRLACLYGADDALFAAYARSADVPCPPALTAGAEWPIVTGTASVVSNNRIVGTVYVERDLSDLWTRAAVAGLTGLGMLVLAAGAAFVLAYRLHRTISAPIAQLAASARAMRPDDERFALPGMATQEDEIGDLVRSFAELLRRVHDANAEREQLLAREREASRLKDEFLAAVSHELRTPLNAILGWVQILTTTTASEQTVAKAIASIARNAQAQTRVIEDLVDVSRIVTGKLHVRFDPVDLREVVHHAVDAIRPAAQTKGVRVTADVPDAAFLVNGDRDRLQQVVWNLLSNAIKFTPARGDVSVTLRSSGHVFEIEVADTGAGIPPSFLPSVFDRFRQADGSMTREHGGLGLGLAIVKELTELHGGSVRVASAGVGAGSTFTIRLPHLAGLHSPELPGTAAAPGLDAPLEGVHVLAVDDNQDSLDVIVAALSGRGARVRVAASGEAALREWEREPADVLVCDLAMPALDGFAVLRAIRQKDAARGRRTAAIAVTAHASEAYQAKTREAGFDAHVSKPYQVSELVRAVSAALGHV